MTNNNCKLKNAFDSTLFMLSHQNQKDLPNGISKIRQRLRAFKTTTNRRAQKAHHIFKQHTPDKNPVMYFASRMYVGLPSS